MHSVRNVGRRVSQRKHDHLPPALVERGLYSAQQFFVGKPLVDDVAQPLGASLGSEGQPALAKPTADDVCNVVVEHVDPLAG
eukprot:790004-Pyramimonas_sp.AAC.2